MAKWQLSISKPLPDCSSQIVDIIDYSRNNRDAAIAKVVFADLGDEFAVEIGNSSNANTKAAFRCLAINFNRKKCAELLGRKEDSFGAHFYFCILRINDERLTVGTFSQIWELLGPVPNPPGYSWPLADPQSIPSARSMINDIARLFVP